MLHRHWFNFPWLPDNSLINLNAITSVTVKWKAGSRGAWRKTLPSPQVSSQSIGGKIRVVNRTAGRICRTTKQCTAKHWMHQASFKAGILINTREVFKTWSYTPQHSHCGKGSDAPKQHPMNLQPTHSAKLAWAVLQFCNRIVMHFPSIHLTSQESVPQGSARFSFGWRWTAQFTTLFSGNKIEVPYFPPSMRLMEKNPVQMNMNFGGRPLHLCWYSAAFHGLMECQLTKWLAASGL